MSARKRDEEGQAERERRQRENERREELKKRQREEKVAERAWQHARRAATTLLMGLGVGVLDGQVYRYSFGLTMGRPADGDRLGALAGARAEVTWGKAGHRRSGHARTVDALTAATVLGPAGLLAGVSRKGVQGSAVIVFADGTMHEKKLGSQDEGVRAQADAVRFNALASAAEQSIPASEPTADPGIGPDRAAGQLAGSRLADQLAKLTDLHACGALTDAEFQAAKARLLTG